MTTHATLRESIASMAHGFRTIGAQPGAWLREEFVLRLGIDCIAQPLPGRFRRRIPKQCFANAAALVIRQRGEALRYCEGFSISDLLPLPIHHAWAIDADNRVIDPTLGSPEAYAYIGVPIPVDDLRRVTDRESRSMFLDPVGVVRFKYMTARCPALAELMARAA